MIADGSRWASRFLLLAACAATAACKDGPSEPRRIPTTLVAESPIAIAADVGTTLAIGATVTVRDQHGEPMSGIAVTFAPTTGAGTVTTTTTRTNQSGAASSGAWTLGTRSGPQRLIARVARLDSVEFTANAAPGAPVSLSVATLGVPNATVGTITTPPITVLDQHANPIPGIAVNFEVRTGGGAATGTATVSDANGVAHVGSWTLGTRSGAQTMAARAAGVPEAILTVNAVADEAEVLTLVAGSDQIIQVGRRLDTPPRISVRDRYDNAVAGRSVTARITDGNGTVATTSVTDGEGVVTVDNWAVGPVEGLNSVTVEVDGLPITVYAKAVPVSTFDIQFRYLTDVSPARRQVFERAAQRWRKVLVGDVPPVNAVRTSNCGLQNSALNETVDDLIIFVRIEPIDGVGEVLGSAGPCALRQSSGLPYVGAMRFDSDDIANMEQSDRFANVVLHEIGHILGIGTLWDLYGFLADTATADPYYNGSSARAGFAFAGGTKYAGMPVPVENSGGPGTRHSHWRESVLNAEVMTGFVESPGTRMPLSLTTIGTLEDMGYFVTKWGDDAYTYTPPSNLGISARIMSTARDFELIEVPFPPPDIGSSDADSSPISAQVVRPARRDRVLRTEPMPVQQVEVRRQR